MHRRHALWLGLTRRRAGLAAALGGCNFRPMLLAKGADDEPVRAELAAIEIRGLDGRLGFLVRNALLDELNPQSLPVPERYVLDVRVRSRARALGIQLDSTITRYNLSVLAAFQLRQKDTNDILVSSSVRAHLELQRQPRALCRPRRLAHRRAAGGRSRQHARSACCWRPTSPGGSRSREARRRPGRALPAPARSGRCRGPDLRPGRGAGARAGRAPARHRAGRPRGSVSPLRAQRRSRPRRAGASCRRGPLALPARRQARGPSAPGERPGDRGLSRPARAGADRGAGGHRRRRARVRLVAAPPDRRRAPMRAAIACYRDEGQ